MNLEFKLIDNVNEIILANNGFGVESVYFNNEQLSNQKIIFGSSTHEWECFGFKYKLVVDLIGVKGSIELFKDSERVDILEGNTEDLMKIGENTNIISDGTEDESNEDLDEFSNEYKGKSEKWWEDFLWSAFFAGISVWFYFELSKIEVSGESIEVLWIIALIYKIGGKVGAVSFLSFVSIVFLYFGISKRIKK